MCVKFTLKWNKVTFIPLSWIFSISEALVQPVLARGRPPSVLSHKLGQLLPASSQQGYSCYKALIFINYFPNYHSKSCPKIWSQLCCFKRRIFLAYSQNNPRVLLLTHSEGNWNFIRNLKIWGNGNEKQHFPSLNETCLCTCLVVLLVLYHSHIHTYGQFQIPSPHSSSPQSWEKFNLDPLKFHCCHYKLLNVTYIPCSLVTTKKLILFRWSPLGLLNCQRKPGHPEKTCVNTCRKAPERLDHRTFLLWGHIANHCTSAPPKDKCFKRYKSIY